MPAANFDLQGKVALITGAGRGIGMSVAETLAMAGCAVVVQDIDQDVAQSVADRIVAAGKKAVAMGGDVTDLTLPSKLVKETVSRLGGIHILINNAAIQNFMPFLDLPIDEMEREYRANIITPVLLCQQVIPIFKSQKWGRIINFGSIQQIRGGPQTVAYSMTKAAIVNLTKALMRELAPDGITINVIAPGYFDTWRNRHHGERMEQQAKQWVPIGRVGVPADCAGTALLLCSDAGAYITGQSIHVDGGMAF